MLENKIETFQLRWAGPRERTEQQEKAVELFEKGSFRFAPLIIDHSYYYEGYNTFKAEEL